MNSKKFLIGGLVGGIAYFFLGYLFYGKLLSDFFMKNAGTVNASRSMDQFVWWALVFGNVCMGFLLSYVFVKSNVISAGAGLVTGAVVGLFSAASYDFVSYATTNLATTTSVLGDIGTFTIMSAITGAIVGWACGLIGKSSS